MNIKPYCAFAKKSFLNCGAYRFEHLMSIVNTLVRIFIFWGIYKALYGNRLEVDGISFQMVMTHFILTMCLDVAFFTNDFYLPRKIYSGSIATELLLPVSLPGRLLADNLGMVFFRFVFQLMPSVIVSSLLIGIKLPVSLSFFILFLMSLILGYGVLWSISFVVQMTSFWLVNVWSVSTLKNVMVNVFSGVMIPLWFLPDWLQSVLDWTPFSSIFFTPIQIYFGRLTGIQIVERCTIQIVWIVIIYSLGSWLWQKGQKKLVVQGG